MQVQRMVEFATENKQEADIIMNSHYTLRDRDCYEPVMHHFSTNCVPLHKVII